MVLPFTTVEWTSSGLKILDQTLLPHKVEYKYLKTVEEVREAIQVLRVRGAPLLGCVTAYGVALAAYKEEKISSIIEAIEIFAKTRGTAYNVFNALRRMEKLIKKCKNIKKLKPLLLQEAHLIKKEDEELCEKIGKNGLPLLPDGAVILTHCNAGALATCGIGTALAPIYLGRNKVKKVYVPETRPLLQGARLTAWELEQIGVEVSVICDSTRGYLLQKGEVDLCIVGADRVSLNGDTANKIGTYTLAVLAKENGVPFYVALPFTTFDKNIKTGTEIPIEERTPEEVKKIGSTFITPQKVGAFNPAFDVTPAKYITAFITDKGVITPPFHFDAK